LSAAVRVGARSHRLSDELDGRQAERQQQRDVAVVRVEPVVAWSHGVGDTYLCALMTATGRDEGALTLPLQATQAFVGQPAQEHVTVHRHQLVSGEIEFERRQPLSSITDQANRLFGERLEALRFAYHAWLPEGESPCQTATIACTTATIASGRRGFRNGPPIMEPAWRTPLD